MKITIERPDGTKITIEGENADKVAMQLSPPPLPTFCPVNVPSVFGPCPSCGQYNCNKNHIVYTDTKPIWGSSLAGVTGQDSTCTNGNGGCSSNTK
jgi:hypothetical protein